MLIWSLRGLAALIAIMTVLPFIPLSHWFVRSFEYPRVQIFVAALAVAVGILVGSKDLSALSTDLILVICLVTCVAYQGYRVFPYTRLSKLQVSKQDGKAQPKDTLRLLVSNVLKDNRDITALRRQIEHNDPDVILLLETDAWWVDQLRFLEEPYPYQLKYPQDGFYGMALYSKLKLTSDSEIRFLVENNIPSIFARIETSHKMNIELYGLHPKPPSPTGNERSIERDAELLIVAKDVRQRTRPTIVTGDMNDVAWSRTTRRFQRISGLLDPRIGRGIYPTFPAHLPLFRFPIDQAFLSEELQLMDLKRLPDIGSDHFPLLIEVAIAPHLANEHRLPEDADSNDFKKAKETVKAAKAQQP